MPIITTMFSGQSNAGLLALPLLIYHATQILLGSASLRPLKSWVEQDKHQNKGPSASSSFSEGKVESGEGGPGQGALLDGPGQGGRGHDGGGGSGGGGMGGEGGAAAAGVAGDGTGEGNVEVVVKGGGNGRDSGDVGGRAGEGRIAWPATGAAGTAGVAGAAAAGAVGAPGAAVAGAGGAARSGPPGTAAARRRLLEAEERALAERRLPLPVAAFAAEVGLDLAPSIVGLNGTAPLSAGGTGSTSTWRS